MKIIVEREIPFIRERLESAGGLECVYLTNDEITPETVRDADAVLGRTRTRCNEALLGGSRVRLAATGTVGLDHFDVEWCRRAGIRVANAPGCNAPAVAQYVISALSRLGFDPGRHTLGVVGKGNIGSLVTDIVRGSGGTVLVCDPPRSDAGMNDEEYLPLEEVLERSDAVTFHVPYTKGGEYTTHHLLDEKGLRRLKNGALVINASRGGVIDEEAALKQGGRGLKWAIDTWEGEPAVNPRFLEMADIATPHIAGYSEKGKQRATRSLIEALNDTFGLRIPTDGLAAYDFRPHLPSDLSQAQPVSLPTFSHVASTFDPTPLTAALKASPKTLETQRDTYTFRPEW